ncbi:hypothetical protein SAMN05444359_13540 [Neolewinella agarilytica]|uniref:Uncharacterized protein n=1 Tax=Neolewinella agarilytica TaxID=478744 RepID=A0A1H9NBB2_9BACT|nr:hypothetical protein SAMN05444359_13540 [Neolewinella agarilytica]
MAKQLHDKGVKIIFGIKLHKQALKCSNKLNPFIFLAKYFFDKIFAFLNYDCNLQPTILYTVHKLHSNTTVFLNTLFLPTAP